MPGTARAAMQVALLGGAHLAITTGRAGRALDAGGDRGEQRLETLDDLLLATDHEAEAALPAPDSPAGPAVDMVNAQLAQLVGATDVVAVVGVPAVDDDIARLECAGHRADRALGDVAGGHHHPDCARL